MALTLAQLEERLSELTSVVNDLATIVSAFAKTDELNSLNLLIQNQFSSINGDTNSLQNEIDLIKAKLNLVIDRVNTLSRTEGLGPRIDEF